MEPKTFLHTFGVRLNLALGRCTAAVKRHARAVPVRVYVGDAWEQAERAAKLRVDAIVQQHELSVRRGEAQLPHRLELVQLGALVKVAVLHTRAAVSKTHP